MVVVTAASSESERAVLRAVDHSYWIGGRRLRGASEVVRSLTPKFDVAGHSRRVAERSGLTAAEVLQGWAKERDDACERGKRLHEAIDAMLTPGPKDPDCDLPQFKAWLAWWQAARRDLDPISVEATVWSEELGVAGTFDLLAFGWRDGYDHVYDWKQNKRFESASRYGERMLPPFDDLQSCELTHYSMQTSIYRLCIEDMRRVDQGSSVVAVLTGDSFVVWLPPTGAPAEPKRLLDLRARLRQWLINTKDQT